MKTHYKTIAILLLLWSGVTVFNITKAVHIDDTAYLEIARQIVKNPLHPMSGEINWRNTLEPNYFLLHPPFMPYLYASVFAIFGESEFILHLVFSLFSLGAIVFFFLLAKNFVPKNQALILTAIWALGPAFIPSQNLMTDIPLAFFWLFFFFLITTPYPQNQILKRYLLAAFLIGVASLTKYVSFILIPILAVDIIFKKRWRYLWVIVIPVIFLSGWSFWNYLDYGGIHILGPNNNPIILSDVVTRLIVWVIILGAMSPFSVMFIPAVLRKKKNTILMVLFMIVTAIISFINWRYPDQPAIFYFLRWLFFANGIFVLSLVLYFLIQTSPVIRLSPARVTRLYSCLILFLWFFGASFFLILYTPFMAVRHVLAVIPVVLVILGRNFDRYVSSKWLYLGLVLTVSLGILLGVSDWVHADTYRYQAKRVSAKYGSAAWFAGHWGFQWYAEKEGMKHYDTVRTILQNGDILVKPTVFSQAINQRDIPNLSQIDKITIRVNYFTFFRLLSNWPRSGEGYYYLPSPRSLPWVISGEPLEEITIYQFLTKPARAGKINGD